MKNGEFMQDRIGIHESERIEILTLQDNYIDITAGDNNEVVSRASSLKNGQFRNSILAEHGFSAVVKIFLNGRARTMLFDFGILGGRGRP